MHSRSSRATMRFAFLDPLQRLNDLPQRVRREWPRWARRVEREFNVQPRNPVTIFVEDNPINCVLGRNSGGDYNSATFLVRVTVNGEAYRKNPEQVFRDAVGSFVHEYVHYLHHQHTGKGLYDSTLLLDVWEEMLTSHAEHRLAVPEWQPNYTKARSRRELARLMREMREDLRKPAWRMYTKWRFPEFGSPNYWGVYKVAWALGKHYLRHHTFAQAIRATSREMRRVYDQVLAELSRKGS